MKGLSDCAFLELDRLKVKGKDEPVTIYEPLRPKDKLPSDKRKEYRQYADALRLYRSQQWDNAEIQFLNLQRTDPDRMLYEVYIDRIQAFRQESLGEDWDGSFYCYDQIDRRPPKPNEMLGSARHAGVRYRYMPQRTSVVAVTRGNSRCHVINAMRARSNLLPRIAAAHHIAVEHGQFFGQMRFLTDAAGLARRYLLSAQTA